MNCCCTSTKCPSEYIQIKSNIYGSLRTPARDLCSRDLLGISQYPTVSRWPDHVNTTLFPNSSHCDCYPQKVRKTFLFFFYLINPRTSSYTVCGNSFRIDTKVPLRVTSKLSALLLLPPFPERAESGVLFCKGESIDAASDW